MVPIQDNTSVYKPNSFRLAFKEAHWIFVNQFIQMLTIPLLSVLLVRSLGPEQYGVYELLKNIFSYIFIFCGLGLNISLMRFIPELIQKSAFEYVKTFLKHILCLQFLMGCIIISGLFFSRHWLNQIFDLNFSGLYILLGVWVLVFTLKMTINDVLSSSYKLKVMSFLSIGYNVGFLFALCILLINYSSIPLIILIQVLGLASVFGFGLRYIIKYFNSIKNNATASVISIKRIVLLSGPNLFNRFLQQMMLQYTEVFFLAVYFSKSIVGAYSLGYTLSFMYITFFPNAVRNFLVSVFSDCYTQNKTSLEKLVKTTFKILILITFPLSALGVFFSKQVFVFVFGADMVLAGTVASLFCIMHVLALLSYPLSIAFITKENLVFALPFEIFLVILNLLLDYFLIPTYGVYGAFSAVFFTFILTLPLRFYMVYRLVGGVYFPGLFCLRFALLSYGLAAILYLLFASLSVGILFLVIPLYFCLWVMGVRLFRMIQNEDFLFLSKLNHSPIVTFGFSILGLSQNTK